MMRFTSFASGVCARLAVLCVALLVPLAGCSPKEEAVPPPNPTEVSDSAIGHYCGMLLVEHLGPKGQVHLASQPGKPVWFSSVRDTLTFMRLPEEPRDIVAVYVNDMGRSSHWDQPDAGAWVAADQAWYVIESDQAGGMGAPEAVPFSQREAADKFQSQHGGRIVRLADVPDEYVLGDPGVPAPADSSHEGEVQVPRVPAAPVESPPTGEAK